MSLKVETNVQDNKTFHPLLNCNTFVKGAFFKYYEMGE